MTGNILLSLYRALTRHRLYAALNVFGLAAGIAIFLVLSLVVRYEQSFDGWIPNAANIFRLDTTAVRPDGSPEEDSVSSFVIRDLLLADFPQIQAGVRILNRPTAVSVGGMPENQSVSYVDPGFLKVFRLVFTENATSDVLATPSSIAISQSTARKYFGGRDPIGRAIDISYQGDRRSYTVGGVFRDLPKNATLKIDMLVLFTPFIEREREFHNWSSQSGETYLEFRNHSDEASVAASLQAFIGRRASGKGDDQLGPTAAHDVRLTLTALPDLHFHDVNVEAEMPGVDPRVVDILGFVGLLALLTAAVNYVNLATARAGLRAREVALRKVLGATKRALLLQFLAEAVILVAVAALFGLAAAELAIPVVNALGGWAVRIDYARVIPGLVLLVIAVGLLAGAYPAILLASYRPAAVFASSRTPAGGRAGTRLRNLLVLAQFVVSITFAICTLVIDAQADFLRNADRGFDRDNLIIVRSTAATDLTARQNSIVDVFARVANVTSVTMSDRQPDTNFTIVTTVNPPGWLGRDPDLVFETVGAQYLPTYRVALLAGRFFDGAHASDDRDGRPLGGRTIGVVLNQRAVHVLGFAGEAAALGHGFTFQAGTTPATAVIIGVVGNVRFMSPRQPVQPQAYFYDSKANARAEAAVRYQGVSRTAMMARLQAAWRSVAPDVPFVAATADERLADFYQPDQQRARLLSAAAVLAAAIACVGLYGLASFNAGRRMHEIGIRKTLGATTTSVLLLLVTQFVRPVLIANVIAWPVAWAVMRVWLAGFDERIALSPLYFLAASGAAIVIAVATVLGQTIRVARAEPARALRHE